MKRQYGRDLPDNFTDAEWAQLRSLNVMASSDRAQLTGKDAELVARVLTWDGLTVKQIIRRREMMKMDSSDPGEASQDVPGSVMP